MSKIILTMYGPLETDYPDDAKCAVEYCGHVHADHTYAANTGHCDLCDRPDGVYDPRAFHFFRPTMLAGGTYSPAQERAAYERAMRGEV